MADAIGPDGLTDEEWIKCARARGGALSLVEACDLVSWLSSSLAAERLAHAETRARAEKAEAERDRLRAALEKIAAIDGSESWQQSTHKAQGAAHDDV